MSSYGSGFYGSGFYGGSVLSMSLFDTDWNIAYTTDDASDPTPSWTTLDQGDIRSVDVSRGRDDELGRVEAGTAQLVLNNLTRSFDPQVVTGLRPMNRWRIRAVHASVTNDVFLGYAESYEQSWPGMGFDAVTTVRLVDEFKVLALDRLPTTEPPRDSYRDLVMFDEPAGYWPMDNATDTLQQAALVGEPLTSVVGSQSGATGAGVIVGQEELPAYHILTTGASHQAILNEGQSGDAGGLTEFTIEVGVSLNVAAPTTDWNLARGPLSSSNDTWRLSMDTARKLVLTARNSGGTTYTCTSTTVWATTSTFHHVVGTITGGSLRLYVDGTQEASTAFTGAFGTMDAGSALIIGTGTATGTGQIGLDEMSFYRAGLAADRVTAHYTAATARGFARSQLAGARITSVLAAASTVAASSVRTGSREMVGSYMKGQSPLDELRKAEDADSVDSMLFIAKDGTITFLDDGHRSVSPWNAVQATFDDDGTDLGYRDLTYDYSETFLFNTIHVTRTGGTTASSTDATSVSRYSTRDMSLTDLPIRDDADAAAIAAALLAKYKDPMTRITSIGVFLYDTGTISEVLTLELADRIRILRTHPAGGARIDQTAFVQKIQLSSRPGQPITVTLGVSPL
jgi:hypothetical protein